MSECVNFDQNIFIIGDIHNQIVGDQLPSKLQTLKLLFFYLRILKKSLRDASSLVIDQVQIFWKKGEIPTQKKYRCIQKLEKLYNDWRELQKHRGRECTKVKINEFQNDICNLFDIAHGNVMDMIDEKKAIFLEQQRKPGRIGIIGNFGTGEGEQTRMSKDELYKKRSLKSENDIKLLDKTIQLNLSEGSIQQTCSQKTVESCYLDFELETDQCEDSGPSTSKRQRGTTNISNSKIVAVLD